MSNHTIPFEINSFDLDNFKKNINFLFKENIKRWYLRLIDLKKIDPIFFEYIEDKFKDKISVTRLFVTPPNHFTQIHFDDWYKWALNIPICGCDNTYNAWYKIKENINPIRYGSRDSVGKKYASNNSGAFIYNTEDIDTVLEKVILDKPMLFDTTTPHNVISGGLAKDELRVVLSVRVESMKTVLFKEIWEKNNDMVWPGNISVYDNLREMYKIDIEELRENREEFVYPIPNFRGDND
tara:strand:+ start:1487 stop:2200 length:714 start_codon:yes stop_codon:yes gene_type:complete